MFGQGLGTSTAVSPDKESEGARCDRMRDTRGGAPKEGRGALWRRKPGPHLKAEKSGREHNGKGTQPRTMAPVPGGRCFSRFPREKGGAR